MFAVLLQRKTKYANGVVSEINLHAKFEVSVFICRIYTADSKI